VKQIVIQKQKLEDLVNIRTQELQKANSEINSKNKQITDSIQYAERIQQSVLPKYKVFDENFADYFILFKPRDIVSGDFYWTHKLGSKIIVCAADCTGHGVPGAFMSMLGMSFLKEIVSKSNISKPGLILDELRNEVIRALQQEGKINEAKDGMDLSLISFDTESKILEYAGANNAIYIFSANESPDFEKNKRVRKRENNFYEIQPDKMPIAIYEKMESFSTFEKKLKTGDRVYLYSDGYADQFGGPNNKKFKYPKFRKIITSTLNKDMTHQFAKLEVAFDEWKKNQSQVDDVTVIGFEVG
jgi:serine phosphatase RsbU (regulator of sigma subunit)